MKSLLFLLILTFPLRVFSYAENVTHGYPNCMACHVSPTGGGILNDYGRALSSELMSTWKTKDFNKPFGGLVENTENLKWGGHIRAIQTRFENDQVESGSLFVMQKNIELAAYVSDFVAVGTFGTKEGPKDRIPDQGDFISERHYLMYQGETTSRLRAGKFRQNYGLNDPNHRRFVKNDLGFGSNSESYQLEYLKMLKGGEFLISTSLGRIDIPQSRQEKNVMAQYTNYLNGKSRLTANALLGESPSERRSLWGVNGVLSFLDGHDVFRFDLNYRISQGLNQGEKAEKEKSALGYVLWGYKVFDGLFPYLVYEHKHEALSESSLGITQSPGIGLQFFPVSHFEIQLEHQYRTSRRDKDNPEQRSYVLLHVYL